MKNVLSFLALLTLGVSTLPAQTTTSTTKPAGPSPAGVKSGAEEECKTPTSRASLFLQTAARMGNGLTRFSRGPHSAVIVDASLPLLHTTQFLPATVSNDAAGQAVEVLDRLQSALGSVASTNSDVVKLHIALASASDLEGVRTVVDKRFPATAKPAITWVVGNLPLAGASVALDAVAVARKPMAPVRDGSILPAGGAIYVSGQAEKGTLPEATQKTLAGLRTTLQQLGVGPKQVIQLKAFLQPMSDSAVVVREMKTFFASQNLELPPVVLVEWSGSAPVEIELIATTEGAGASAPSATAGPVEYITPDGMKPSPVYTRVVRMNNSGRRVYISGMYASAPGLPAADQVNDTFKTLQSLMKQAGGDLRHLVKATYYVTDEETSRKLNELRPAWYDAQRPPAASKAAVRGTGIDGRQLAMDMIAILPPANP